MKVIEKLRNSSLGHLIKTLPKGHLYAVSGLALGLIAINIGADEQKRSAEKPRVLASGRLNTVIDIPNINSRSSVSEDSNQTASKSTNQAPNIPTEHADTAAQSAPLKPNTNKGVIERELISFDGKSRLESDPTKKDIEDIYNIAKESQLAENITPVSLKVKSGDSLAKLFKKAGLNEKHMRKLLGDSSEAKKLTRIKPGQGFDFYIQNKKLKKLVHIKDRLHSDVFEINTDGIFENEKVKLNTESLAVFRSGTIKQSLYLAGVKAKLDDELIMELASIFGWDIDFALDIRKGDQFKILFEEEYIDEEKVGNGHILAAEFVNQGKSYRAVRYVDKNNKEGYFTPSGESMRKAFLRAPLDFRRISSNFNPKRLHPISKRVKPHRGTDYAAARGTPVWSSGNGRVIASGYTKPNGNYIVIQHGNNIQTKYLHLHKRYVSKGKRVKQKQVIGTVGSTGFSNGPHLHYEFLLNGVHRNPRTIVQKLPKAKSIPKDELHRFASQTQPLMSALKNKTSQTKLASIEGSVKSL